MLYNWLWDACSTGDKVSHACLNGERVIRKKTSDVESMTNKKIYLYFADEEGHYINDVPIKIRKKQVKGKTVGTVIEDSLQILFGEKKRPLALSRGVRKKNDNQKKVADNFSELVHRQ